MGMALRRSSLGIAPALVVFQCLAVLALPFALCCCLEMTSALQRNIDAYYTLYQIGSYYSPLYPGGMFTVHADGRVTLTQEIKFAEEYFGDYRDDTIRITGQRLSTTTFNEVYE